MIYLCDLLVDMKIIFFFFALILFPKPAEYELIKHDFHLSKSKIKYRSESKTWEISAHIFIDDLQEAIKQKGVDISSMFDEYEEDYVDEAIYYYLLDNILIDLDGKRLEAEWIGKEISEDLYAVWAYMEIPQQSLYGELKVDNNILVEVFDDQSNITVIELPERRKEFLTFQKSDDFKLIDY